VPAAQDRYHRQTLLPGFGEEGQRRLASSSILLVGCGALGCAIADLLARAGVGHLTIVDRDTVELTNLQRQCLFDERDAAEAIPKAEAARRRLALINSGIDVRPLVADFNAANAKKILEAAAPALLLDGTDNFETRYLLNDLAVSTGLPYCYGGVVGMSGLQMTIRPGETPCLRCLFEQPPAPGSTPTCDTAGVFGPLVQMVASLQASDAIKLLLGRADAVAPVLIQIDPWTSTHRALDIAESRRPDCPCCAERRFEFLDSPSAASTALCGQNAIQVCPAGADGRQRLDLQALAHRLRPHGDFEAGRFFLRGELSRERSETGAPFGLTVFPDGRAIVRGTTRPELARSIYARFIGG
jgi:molybdopterin/thiamine biosynthesis adenylyltransferase